MWNNNYLAIKYNLTTVFCCNQKQVPEEENRVLADGCFGDGDFEDIYALFESQDEMSPDDIDSPINDDVL